MKKTILVSLILAGICLLLAARSNPPDISPAQQKTIREEILKVQEEMKAAAENLDIDELYRYVLDVNDVIIENGQLRANRKDAIEITRQGLQGLKQVTYTYAHKNVTALSTNTALWTATGTTTVVLEDDRRITGDFAETVVFVLRDGQWRVLHAHRSSPR